MILWLSITASLALAAAIFDAVETMIGLRKGVAVEGNTVINFLSGSLASRVPHAAAVYGYNIGRIAAFTALAFTGNPALIGGAFGGLIAVAIGHTHAAFRWRFLIAGGKIDPAKKYTWWQKLLKLDW